MLNRIQVDVRRTDDGKGEDRAVDMRPRDRELSPDGRARSSRQADHILLRWRSATLALQAPRSRELAANDGAFRSEFRQRLTAPSCAADAAPFA